MAHPHYCPLCGAAYGRQADQPACHLVLHAEPGGTASPGRPSLPGQLLTLACLACGGVYRWDYFGGATSWPTPGASASYRASGRQPHRAP